MNRPLSDRERADLGRANVWLMDFECDGGTPPPAIAALPHDRPLTPAEARLLLAWFHRTAPGDF